MSILSVRSPNCSSKVPSRPLYTPIKGKENFSSSLVTPPPSKPCTLPKHEGFVDFTNISLKEEPMEMKPKVKNPLFVNKNINEIPIPKGNTAYSKAKRAEYVERDLAKAEKYYKIAIRQYERLDSAIKDLATVLHQQGKTEEACKFLEKYRHHYRGDKAKYENLLINLRKQIVPSGNCLNRTLVLFDPPVGFADKDIRDLFGNNSRVLQIEMKKGCILEDAPTTQNNQSNETNPSGFSGNYCLIHFASYSAARKTLETAHDSEKYQFYWMNIYGKLAGRAEISKPLALNIEENSSETPRNTTTEPANTETPSPQRQRISQTPPQTSPETNAEIDLSPKSEQKTPPNTAQKQEEDNIKQEESLDHEREPPGLKPLKTIQENIQRCWKNCLIIVPSIPSWEDSLITDVKVDLLQEVLLSQTVFKVFENEDKSWNSSYWKRLIRRTCPINKETMDAQKSCLWDKIEKKESEVKGRMTKEHSYIDKLLLQPTQPQESSSSDETTTMNNNEDNTPKANEKLLFSNNEVLEFFPNLHNYPKDLSLARKATTIVETNYQLFPKRSYGTENIIRRPVQQMMRSGYYHHNMSHFGGNNMYSAQNSFVNRQESERYASYPIFNKNF